MGGLFVSVVSFFFVLERAMLVSFSVRAGFNASL